MALTTTRYYRWDDVGAPVLSGEIGAGLNVLRKCLVGDASGIAYGTGQHAKPAAGWSEPFADTNVSVFQNPIAHGATGLMVRVDDRGLPGWYGGQHFMRARVYDRDSMTSIDDTGTNPTPPPNWRGGAVFQHGIGIRKSNESNSNPKKWIVVADELTCYIWTQCSIDPDYQYLGGLHGFGDAELWDATPDMQGFIFGSHDAGAYSAARGYSVLHMPAPNAFQSPQNSGQDDRGQFICYNSAGAGPAPWAVAALSTGSNISSASSSSSTHTGSAGMFIGGQDMLPVMHGSTATYIPAHIASQGLLRGRMRGLYAPMSNLLGTPPVNDVVAAGAHLVCVRTNSYNAANQYLGTFAIETQAPW